VVLGDPGGGKSTLCQYLCYHLAKQFNIADQVDNSEEKAEDGKFDQQFMKVPLRVVLRSFESARVTSPQLTIFDYIANDLRSVANAIPLTQLQDFLRYALTYGYAVLAFDGLDEILNTATMRWSPKAGQVAKRASCP
jgi:predicted NACHT family NTPase